MKTSSHYCYSRLLTPLGLLVTSDINSIFYSLGIMNKLISLKPIFVSFVSPKKQKRVQANCFSDPSCHSHRSHRFSASCHSQHSDRFADSPSPSPADDLSTEADDMPIPVSDELRQWLISNNLQGFIKVAEAEPHPNADTLIQQIHVTSITTKKV